MYVFEQKIFDIVKLKHIFGTEKLIQWLSKDTLFGLNDNDSTMSG